MKGEVRKELITLKRPTVYEALHQFVGVFIPLIITKAYTGQGAYGNEGTAYFKKNTDFPGFLFTVLMNGEDTNIS